MNKFIFLAAIFFMATLAVAEPPAERIEGAKLDPELLARVKDLLINDKPANSASGFSRGAPSSTYGAPAAQPASTYGAPSSGGYDSMMKSFGAAAPVGPSGGFSNSFSAPPAAPIGGEVTLSDPIPAPLLATFDLSPTVEKRS